MNTASAPGRGSRQVLALATMSQSLRYQSPGMWDLLAGNGLDVTYAAAPDQWSSQLGQSGSFEPVRLGRRARLGTLLTGAVDTRRLMRRDWALTQVQSPIAAALVRLAPRSCPLLYVAHGFHFHRDGGWGSNVLYAGVEWALAGRCDALAVVCEEDFEAAVTLGLHRRTLLWRLPGAGVDLDAFPGTPKTVERELQLLFIGELNSNKDPLKVADVVQRLHERGHPARGTIVGDGPLRAAVAARVEAQPESVRWFPQTSVPAQLLQRCDVLVAPSGREGLPRVVIEALATGRPVVARSNRGTRELVIEPQNGRLLTVDSPLDAWADAVLAVQGSSAEDVLARRESVRRYGSDAFGTSYCQLVDRVLSGLQRPGAVDLADQEAAPSQELEG